ncbi:hypothetical protein CVT25_009274 [Psilocybe cyanescens]|uniref:Uncharacterized protein n=1 Tax=Psilocybe cyanescens TaxID=93625 RepID=A0A409WWD3_PSICY|nr:hypothetical protein CVT25_009274 [Psilocybe cyanescens]
MSTTNIILSTPHNYDLQGLAETTRQSLELLRPWTLLAPSPSNPLVSEIVSKAAKYVSAVQMGVSAAYSGFTVTEEVLFLASALPIEDRDDLQQYLFGMMDLAREARENANNAFQAFRNVRVEIIEPISKLTEQLKASQKPDGQSHSTSDFPKYNKAELDVLVKFSEYISNYANWWDWIKIETDPSPSTKDLPVAFQLDSLTDPEAVKRWKHLRSQYTAYVQVIGELEDADPEFFNSAPFPSSRASTTTTTTAAAATVPSTDAPKASSLNTASTTSAPVTNGRTVTNSPRSKPKCGGEKEGEKGDASTPRKSKSVGKPKRLGVSFLQYFIQTVNDLPKRIGPRIMRGTRRSLRYKGSTRKKQVKETCRMECPPRGPVNSDEQCTTSFRAALSTSPEFFC